MWVARHSLLYPWAAPTDGWTVQPLPGVSRLHQSLSKCSADPSEIFLGRIPATQNNLNAGTYSDVLVITVPNRSQVHRLLVLPIARNGEKRDGSAFSQDRHSGSAECHYPKNGYILS